MSIDVPYLVFRNLSPRRLEPFFECHKIKQKLLNKHAWIQGIYIQQAIGSAFSKNNKYPSEPFDIFDAEKTKLSDEDKFSMWVAVANQEFKD